jgi:predicted lactoylglutathione lyase
MAPNIFVNMAVGDVARSRSFFEAIGWRVNEQFTDEQSVCVVISDTVYAMLHSRERFAGYSHKTLVDASTTIETILAVTVASREEVDVVIERALAAGASSARLAEDHGIMYARSFHDLDGHLWEVLWMAPDAD